jgi:uncharacterized membrane protein
MRVEARREDERETGRLEAFSDGVFAVAVTLLVLDLRVPSVNGDRALLTALRHDWPSYFAYFTSFYMILIMWLNHHANFRAVRYTDHWIYMLNGLLLLMISLVPFATSLVARYLRSDGGHVAAFVFSGLFLVLASVWNLMWRYIVHHPALHDRRVNPAWMQAVTRRNGYGLALYVVPVVLALVNAVACVGMVLAMAIFFTVPLGIDHFLPEEPL